MMDPHGASARRSRQLAWTVVIGFVLGGLLTELATLFLPDSAPRTFLATSAALSVSPFSMDLIGVSMTLGFGLQFNVLTVVGIAIVGFVVRSWL